MNIDAAHKVLKECELKHKALAQRIADIGFIWQGSVSKRYIKCGKASCACSKDPASRHGPYYYWTTKVKGKTVAKKLDGAHAELLQQWVNNRIEMDSIIAEMKKISEEALEAALIIAEEEQVAAKKPQE